MLHTCTMVCKVNQEFLESVSCHLMEGGGALCWNKLSPLANMASINRWKWFATRSVYITPVRAITSLTQYSSCSLFHAMNSKEKLETWNHFSLPQREHSLAHAVCSNWYSDCQESQPNWMMTMKSSWNVLYNTLTNWFIGNSVELWCNLLQFSSFGWLLFC